MAVTVDTATQHQTIEGFGAGLIWTPALSDAAMDRLFTTGPGCVGLTWARVSGTTQGNGIWASWTPAISPTYGISEAQAHAIDVANGQKAQARGVKMYACFNEARPEWFEYVEEEGYPLWPGPDGYGRLRGPLDPAAFGAYCQRIADLVPYLQSTYGITLHAVEPVNEAQDSINVGVDSSRIAALLRDHLWPRVSSLGVRVIAPSVAFPASQLPAYADAIYNAAPAFPAELLAALSLSGHGYGGAPFVREPRATSVHQTEWWTHSTNLWDGSINSGLEAARKIHDDLTVGWVTQWTYFLAQPRVDVQDLGGMNPPGYNFGILGPNGEGTDGTANKKVGAIGQFSRFVRPGYHRVACTGAPAGVSASAYTSPGGDLVVVCVNENAVATPIDFSIASGDLSTSLAARSVTTFTRAAGTSATSAYRTSATEDLAALGLVIPGPLPDLSVPVGGSASWTVDADGSSLHLTLDAACTLARTLRVRLDGVEVGTAPIAGDVASSPMTTAHRTSGVAPLAVFFDAVNDVAATPTDGWGNTRPTYAWTSGVTQPADMEGANWVWDFGDSISGTWDLTTGKSKNTATGYTAAHVYETPGTYTATLTVTTVAGVVATYTQPVTVAAFSGETRYVSGAGNDAWTGAAPTHEVTEPPNTIGPWLNFSTGLTWLNGGANRQLLLRRGDSFTLAGQWLLTATGPNMLGAYADGTPGHTAGSPRPILTTSWGGDGTNQSVLALSNASRDWRAVDIDARADTNGELASFMGPALSWPGGTQDFLLLRVKTSVYQGGVIWDDGVGLARGLFIVSNEIGGTTNCNAYVGGRQIAVLGCVATDNSATHNLRVWQAHKGVISNNLLARCGGRGHNLKLHGPAPTPAVIYNGKPETRWVSITDNVFQGRNDATGDNPWNVAAGSQSAGSPDEASILRHIIWERNLFKTGIGPPARALAETEASSTVIRNNVFDLTWSNDAIAIHLYRYGGFGAVSYTPDDNRIYNNTVYKGSAGNGNDAISTLLETDLSATNVRCRNNLYGATSLAATAMIDGTGGAGFAQDHNLLTDAPGFVNAAGGDLTLTAGSPALGQGTPLGEVREDAARNARPATTPDLGAYERA
jgi:O-glycosyl hydrolase